MEKVVIVVTTNEIHKKEICAYHGVVKGVVTKKPNLKQVWKSGITFTGNNDDALTNVSEEAREQAYGLMIEDAKRLGANAIIGMRYDSVSAIEGRVEIVAYGTAVTVEQVA
ncbi:heavy metal-binding domain-containing protein [Vibrio parahaemolyticus]|nr:heavy metal-binding domain-containing protein [Vibrio parahaemolyticus]